jgi:hypothetical protein
MLNLLTIIIIDWFVTYPTLQIDFFVEAQGSPHLMLWTAPPTGT